MSVMVLDAGNSIVKAKIPLSHTIPSATYNQTPEFKTPEKFSGVFRHIIYPYGPRPSLSHLIIPLRRSKYHNY